MSQSTVLVSNLGSRLRRYNPLGKQVLLVHFLMIVSTNLTYEIGQAEEPMNLIWAGTISVLGYFGVFLSGQWLVTRIAPSFLRTFLIAAVTVISYVSKSAILLLLLYPNEWIVPLGNRLLGDITISLSFYWLMSAIVATSFEDLERAQILVSKSRENLKAQRSLRLKSAAEFDRTLKQKIENALTNELQQIATKIMEAKDSKSVADISKAINDLVENRVRPLTRELMGAATRLASAPPIASVSIKKLTIPTTRPSRDTRAWLLFLIATPNLFATAYQNSNLVVALYYLGTLLMVPVLVSIVASLMGDRPRSLIGYSLLLDVQVTIAYIPAFLLITSFQEEFPELAVLRVTGWGFTLGILQAGLIWSAYFFAQKDQIDLATKLNEETQHELDLIDQTMWVTKRKWTYVVHGSVQSALTVAFARLSSATYPAVEDALLSVRQALASISQPAESSSDVKALLQSVSKTWEGVCEFQFELTPSVVKALAGKETQITCLVEIAKELVSNAHRHGKATKLWLNVYMTSNGDIELVSGNNGSPFRPDAAPSLGSQLFADLTSDFDFDAMRLGGFRATVAMPR